MAHPLPTRDIVRFRSIVTPCSPLLALAVAGAASATPTLTQLSGPGAYTFARSSAACPVGVPGPAAAPASYFFPLTYEEFRLSFDPAAGCSTCTAGFRIASIHVVLEIHEPCTLTMVASLGTLDASTSPECPRPAGTVCEGPVQVVEIPDAGVWDVELPADCGCVPVDAPYTLGFRMLDMSCWPVLMTDGEPTPCTNWDNIGWGWVDLPGSDSEWPGDLLLYADAECCASTGAIENAPARGAVGLRIFPNPATDDVTVSFALAEPATVDLAVYDVGGRRVASLHQGPLGRGTFLFPWSAGARPLPSGTYFVRLVQGGKSVTSKVVLIRP